MKSMLELIKKIYSLMRQVVYALDNEKNLLYLNWILRMLALVVTAGYFAYYQSRLDETVLRAVRISLLLFFAYNVLSGFLGIIYRDLFIKVAVKIVQFLVEIIFYAGFYFLSRDPHTDLYFLFFLPLFFAARFLTFYHSLFISAWGGLFLYLAIHALLPPGDRSFNLPLEAQTIFWPRFIILFAITTAYAFHRRNYLREELLDPNTQIKDILHPIEDGIFIIDKHQQLVFVNDALKTRHGGYQPGQLWWDYFRSHDREKESQRGISLVPTAPIETTRKTFIDKDGMEYQAELDMRLLYDENGKPEITMIIVRDVNRPVKIEELKKQLRIKGDQVQSLISQRALWQVTFAELGKHMLGMEKPQEILDVAVRDVCQRLNAETASIFFLKEASLQRQAVFGFAPELVPDEAYQPGIGITGRVLSPSPGSRFGQPVISNHVDQDQHVVTDYLQAYKNALPSHQVKHLLAVPLNSQEKTIGVLRVVNKLILPGTLSREGFNSDDQDFLTAIASLAAVAVENRRLVNQEKTRRQYSEAILEVTQQIKSGSSNRAIYKEIINELAKILDFSSISIQVLQKDNLNIVECAGFGRPEELKRRNFPANDPKFPNHLVLREMRTLRINDISKEYPHFKTEDGLYQSGNIRSWMGIPMIIRDRVIGMVAIDHEKPGFFTREMEEMAASFIHQVTIAMDNAQLFQNNQAQVQELKAIALVSQTIAKSVDLDEEMKKIVTMAKEMSRSIKATVVLYNNGSFDRSFGDRHLDQPLHKLLRPNGVAFRVAATKRKIIYNHVRAGDPRHNSSVIREDVKSYATIPLLAGGKVLGILVLSSDKSNHYQRSMLQTLETLSNQAAVAIEHALLVEILSKQSGTMRDFVETSKGLIVHTELENLIKYCGKTATDIFQVEDCSLFLLNKDRNVVEFLYSEAIPSELWHKREVTLDGPGLTAYVARTGETLNLGKEDYQKHPAWGGNTGSPFLEHLPHLPSRECHSLLLGPIKDSRGNTVGVLKLENKIGTGKNQKFPQFDLDLFTTFASHIGTAIERAQLFEKLDTRAQKVARDSIFNDLHEISTYIHSILVLRLQYLWESLNRNPQLDIRSEIELLSKYAQSSHSQVRLIMAGVKGYEILQESGLIPALEYTGILLKIPVTIKEKGKDVYPIEIETALYRIGNEALFNSFASGGPGVKITIYYEHDSGRYNLTVSDNGKGFDVDAMLADPSSHGLNSMKNYAGMIGATCTIKSAKNVGTTISVTGNYSRKGGAA